MSFEIVKTFNIKSTPAGVWAFLIDPQRVARCLPGASITAQLDEKTYSGAMTVKVGPVSSSYKGKVVFEKLDAQTRTATIVATGTDVKGRGGADLRLTASVREIAPGETEVKAPAVVLPEQGASVPAQYRFMKAMRDQLFIAQRIRIRLGRLAPSAASGIRSSLAHFPQSTTSRCTG